MTKKKGLKTADVVQTTQELGSFGKAAKHFGVDLRTIQYHWGKAYRAGDVATSALNPVAGSSSAAIGKPKGEEGPRVEGRVQAMRERELPLPKAGVKRYLLTSAQNNTPVHQGLWNNLNLLAQHYDAEIFVSRFTYDKNSYKNDVLEKDYPSERLSQYDDVYYTSEVLPVLVDERVQMAPGLVWCGEMNILPTAVRPLSGFESYTGRSSGIFPHVKLAMESIPSGKHEPTKFNYTTGTVTMRNYIQRKAGLKAEFHHCYGALLVEVTPDGAWYCRQVNGNSEGTIYDLDIKVQDGVLTTGNRLMAVNWGDIHVAQLQPTMEQLCWGEGGVLDALRPKYQFMHDTLDFRSRNHHDRYNPHKMFSKFTLQRESVRNELKDVADFLRFSAFREWCETIVVESNHDNALTRWLANDPAWYAKDPINAVIFLELQLAQYKKLQSGDQSPLLPDALDLALGGKAMRAYAKFLAEDESFIICHDRHGGIECGMHGHNGPNGRRGARNAFAKMGRKSNVGHSHSGGITDGCYQAGVSADMDMGFNVGPSSWSQSGIFTYDTGKRSLFTIWNGRAYAPR